MKKYVPPLLLFLFLLTGCGGSDIRTSISETLCVNLSNTSILISENSHGGFHGDGETFVVLEFPADTPFECPESDFWHGLPLEENTRRLLYEFDTAFLRDEEGHPRIPEVTNGCWFFYDRHSQSLSPFDDAGLFSRASFNCTIALYDADTNLLYFYELDT